ncbi:hypothetical protein [Natranaerobius thermophilus]|uniref:Uncharacterized protein n=1 Tax=Natranaerobius thermophilus (strain ATCC BAA-1301 / DSM 18059 / JW/NM-WN-LF) TaxID=457570 RepID=B2A209_NATTJ|nr:hypothetical protein [Natranaerobius thermophilus]ACB84814.1 hypothetical protein Nther_1231 [Natranaerobius thermophilus JW/NM-WN-LF]
MKENREKELKGEIDNLKEITQAIQEWKSADEQKTENVMDTLTSLSNEMAELRKDVNEVKINLPTYYVTKEQHSQDKQELTQQIRQVEYNYKKDMWKLAGLFLTGAGIMFALIQLFVTSI